MTELDAVDTMINDLMPVESRVTLIKKPYKHKPVKEKAKSRVFKTNLKKVMRKGKSEADLFELFRGGA